MSYFSDVEYKIKNTPQGLWFEKLYFERWFKDMKGPILDIGCATGNFIAVKPEIIEGVENDPDSYKIAKERGFNVFKLDVEKEMDKLASAKYEGIYAKQIIEHLYDPLNFLKEIKRILKPRGKAVILTPNCPFMLDHFWGDYTHRRPLTRTSLTRICYDVGLKNIKIYEDFRCFPGLGRLMRAFHLKPEWVRAFQKILGIKGYALILEIINN
jgi:SAM-dependent methyltransferase